MIVYIKHEDRFIEDIYIPGYLFRFPELINRKVELMSEQGEILAEGRLSEFIE